jgi:predicted AAA+ superfamily ATPase
LKNEHLILLFQGCIEQLLAVHGERHAWFWGTHGGAELDLLLLRDGRRVGYEFKYSETPSTTKSMHAAIADLGLEELNVVHPGTESFQIAEKIWAKALADCL